MSDITLKPISAPNLNTSEYGANIKGQFDNINDNFRQIVEGEYLKGQSGDIVMLEQVNLADSSHPITALFNEYIASLQVGDDGIGEEDGCINSSYLYMIYTKNEETEDVVYKTSLPYTFLDPRFNPITEEAYGEEIMDKSCIIVYDGEQFTSYNAFPNIYFNEEQNEFCWKINGLATPLPARGPKGETGYAGSFYVLQSTGNIDKEYHTVSFILNPNNLPDYTGVIKGEDIVNELEGQSAFVYCNGSGYLTTIEKHQQENEIYAKCLLDPSLNIYNIFSGEALVDVLVNNTVKNNGFGSLFLPVKEEVNGNFSAHTLTTKLAGDTVGADPDYIKDAKPDDLVLSPGSFTKISGQSGWRRNLMPDNKYTFVNNYPESKFPWKTIFNETETTSAHMVKSFTDEAHINESITVGSHTGEGTSPEVSGNLTVFDRATIGCRSSYYNEMTGFVESYNFGDLWVGSTINIGDNTGVLRAGEVQLGQIPWRLSTQRGGEYFTTLNLTPEIPAGQTSALKINSTIDSLRVKSVWPLQRSLYIPYGTVSSPTMPGDIMPETFVYLTWGKFSGEIPHILENDNYANADKKYLSLGDSHYLLYAHSPKSSISGKKYVPSTLNLTFDLSKPIPYTVIDVSCNSPLKSISFTIRKDDENTTVRNASIYCNGFGGWAEDDPETIAVDYGEVKTIVFDSAPKLNDDGSYAEDENGEIIFETLAYDKIIISPISADESEPGHSMDYMLSVESRSADSLDRFISNVAESKWVPRLRTDVKVAVAANTLSLPQFNRIANNIKLPTILPFSSRSVPEQQEEELDAETVTQNFIDALSGRLEPESLANSLEGVGRFALAGSTEGLNVQVSDLKVDLEKYRGEIFDENGKFKPSIIKDAFGADSGNSTPFTYDETAGKLKFNPKSIKDAFDNDEDNPSPFTYDETAGKLKFNPKSIKGLFELDKDYNSPFVFNEDTKKLKFNPQVLVDNTELTEEISGKVSLRIGDKTSGSTSSAPTIDTSNFVKHNDLAGYMTKAELGINSVNDFRSVVKKVVDDIDLTPTIKTTFGIRDGETFEDKVLGTLGVTSAKPFTTLIRDVVGLQDGQSLDDRISEKVPKIDESKFITTSRFDSEKAELNTEILKVTQSIDIPTWETLKGRPSNILTEDGLETQISKRRIVTSDNFVTSFNNSTLAGRLALKTELPTVPTNIVTADNLVTQLLQQKKSLSGTFIPTKLSQLEDGANILTKTDLESSFNEKFANRVIELGIITNENVGTLMTSATGEALESNPTFKGVMKSVYKWDGANFEKDSDGNYVPVVLTNDDVTFSGNTLSIGTKTVTVPTKSGNSISWGSSSITVPSLSGNKLTYGTTTVNIPSLSGNKLTCGTTTVNIPSKVSELTGGSDLLTKKDVSLSGDTLTINGSSKTLFNGKWDSITDKPFIPTKVSDLSGGSDLLTKKAYEADKGNLMAVITASVSHDDSSYYLGKFCNMLIRGLNGNQEMPREKMLVWGQPTDPCHVVRITVGSDSELKNITLMLAIEKSKTVEFQGETWNVEALQIKGQDDNFSWSSTGSSTNSSSIWGDNLIGIHSFNYVVVLTQYQNGKVIKQKQLTGIYTITVNKLIVS
jgi:hypothetical protein